MRFSARQNCPRERWGYYKAFAALTEVCALLSPIIVGFLICFIINSFHDCTIGWRASRLFLSTGEYFVSFRIGIQYHVNTTSLTSLAPDDCHIVSIEELRDGTRVSPYCSDVAVYNTYNGWRLATLGRTRVRVVVIALASWGGALRWMGGVHRRRRRFIIVSLAPYRVRSSYI